MVSFCLMVARSQFALVICSLCMEEDIACSTTCSAIGGEKLLDVGSSVRLFGLSNNALNGFEGTIVTNRGSNHRYGVRLSNDRCVSIRDRNLVQIDELMT